MPCAFCHKLNIFSHFEKKIIFSKKTTVGQKRVFETLRIYLYSMMNSTFYFNWQRRLLRVKSFNSVKSYNWQVYVKTHAVIESFSSILKYERKTRKKLAMKRIYDCLVVCFRTAVLPVTMRCLQRKLDISREVSTAVLSFGSILNMESAALYEVVAAMFINQVNGRASG